MFLEGRIETIVFQKIFSFSGYLVVSILRFAVPDHRYLDLKYKFQQQQRHDAPQDGQKGILRFPGHQDRCGTGQQAEIHQRYIDLAGPNYQLGDNNRRQDSRRDKAQRPAHHLRDLEPAQQVNEDEAHPEG